MKKFLCLALALVMLASCAVALVSADDVCEHEWGEWTRIVLATETQKGVEMRLCKKDPSHVETRLTPALGHTLTHVAAVAATPSADVPERIAVKYVEPVSPPAVVRGDLTGDSKVNARDVIELMKLVIAGHATATDVNDLNNDGKVNARDVIEEMKLVVAGAK